LALPFSGGLAEVYLPDADGEGGVTGYINRSGEFVWQAAL
jgi:hypothetical protein